MFCDSEMRRRRAAFGAELERSGVSYALVYGASRSGSAVSWLTGWPVTREALLVAGPDQDDDVLLVSFLNHVPQARRLSRVRVEWAGPRAMTAALDLLAVRGPLPGRIGLAGALPFDQYRLLAEQVNRRRSASGSLLEPYACAVIPGDGGSQLLSVQSGGVPGRGELDRLAGAAPIRLGDDVGFVARLGWITLSCRLAGI